jgi:hypothetical protein
MAHTVPPVDAPSIEQLFARSDELTGRSRMIAREGVRLSRWVRCLMANSSALIESESPRASRALSSSTIVPVVE